MRLPGVVTRSSFSHVQLAASPNGELIAYQAPKLDHLLIINRLGDNEKGAVNFVEQVGQKEG